MIRSATAQDAALLARLHDQARADWPDFSPESPEGVESAITEDGMEYLLLGDRAAACLYADRASGYGFLDFPYADAPAAGVLVRAALERLAGLRVECPLPGERTWEAHLLASHGFRPGRTQRRMVHRDLAGVGVPVLPPDARPVQPPHDEVEALHDLTFRGVRKLAGWRTDPEIFPALGLRVDGKLAGYALTSAHGGFSWLWELAVHPDFRRRGLGRALTELALGQLREAGASEVHLYVNDDHDQHAPTLYEEAGFRLHRLTIRHFRQP